jgi:glyoxylate/hydroxypyruvate reductase A
MTKKPVLLFACAGIDEAAWLSALNAALPDVELRIWPEVGDPAEIDYALLWKRPASIVAELTNLRVLFSMGAGVELLLADPELPANLPLVRMVDPSLGEGMREYVLHRVLHYHRRMPELAAAQRERVWKPLVCKAARDQRVSILGLGELGRSCAAALVALGFDVAGWSRTPRDLPGVTPFSGDDGLKQMLGRTDILVCLLPLTPATEGILCKATFDAMPPGGFLINVARGRHLVEQDLLAAFDDRQLAHATLDVFREEPLPRNHPFWDHPLIDVTPHCSALTSPTTAARTLAANIARDVAGEPIPDLVDRSRGY